MSAPAHKSGHDEPSHGAAHGDAAGHGEHGAEGEHGAHEEHGHGHKRHKKHDHPKHAHSEGWMVSFADLLMLLLCFFIMLIAFSAGDEGRTRKALGSLLGSFGIPGEGHGFDRTGRYTASVDYVSLTDEQLLFSSFEGFMSEDDIAPEDADVYVDEAGRARIRFADAFLFDKHSARFHPRVIPTLDRLALMLKALGRSVTVEGHTDQARGFESNWRLSASRAQAVLRYLEVAGELPSTKLRAAGFADGRPVERDTGKPGATGLGTKNRRVEIVVE